MREKLVRTCVITFGIVRLVSASLNDFPVPEIIHENIEFWKKIYAEIPLNEGLLHDREYPSIIYERIRVPQKSTEQSSFISAKKAEYEKMLIRIRDSSVTLLSEKEKEIKSRFAGSSERLPGAETRIRFQLGQRERFIQGLERSYMYLDTIVSILREYGVPERLKYLPHVESSFDPEAYSRVGAAGMWQFMRSTGKYFMQVDYSIDERLDPIRSTVAAARLLKQNYSQLQSWALAITAYNHGVNGMRRAVASTGSNDISVILQKHESPSFRFASKNFYACFIAASSLADSVDHYFPNLQRKAPIKAKAVTVSHTTKPSVVCKQYGITEDEFRQFNPAFRPVVFQQQRPIPAGFSINVPVNRSVKDAVVPVLVHAKADPEHDLQPGYYTVSRGDNLLAISKKFDVTIQEIIRLNNLTQPNRIYVGQVLRLPLSNTGEVVIAEQLPGDSSRASTSSTVALSDTGTVDSVREKGEEDVYSETPDEKMEITDVIASQPVDTSAMVIADTALPRNRTSQFDASLYDLGITLFPGGMSAAIRVATNETVGHYAEWMRIEPAAIYRLNDLRKTALHLGREVVLPIGPKSDVKNFEVMRLEYHMMLEEDFFSRYEVTGTRQRSVRAGETVWAICTKEQIPVWLLKKYNRSINLSLLKKGVRLIIPETSAKSAHVPPMLTDTDTDTIPIITNQVESGLQ